MVDRFQLILEIFLRRASTREAKLQIDLARLRYELANAKEKVRLARIGEQPGFQGLGKYEVDVYYETVRRQVNNIQRKLKDIRKTRELRRQWRRELGFPLVSLAGYTNSGKSTLFNSLANENVPVDAGLFTTLSTTTRMINLFGEKILLTDTVGFIDRLPLTLVEAFRSTLEETIFSDLILLVVDVSEPPEEVERKILCCLETIREIGASGIPIIAALNKIDLLSKEELQQRMESLENFTLNFEPISALHKTNLDFLKRKIANNLQIQIQSSFTIPMNSESWAFLSWVFEHSDVLKVAYEEENINVSLRALPYFVDIIKNRVERLGGVFAHG